MKILKTHKNIKQNAKPMLKSSTQILMDKNRITRIVVMSDLIQRQQNGNKYQNLMQNFCNSQSGRRLHNFKKNYNKVQRNIQKDQVSLLKCMAAMKNRKSCKPLYERTTIRRSQINLKKDQRKSQVFTSQFRKRHSTDIFKGIKKYRIYPRYKILQLHSLYNSILSYSQNDPKKFLIAFESALSCRKITLKSQIIRKNLYQQKHLQFEDFLYLYKKMEDLMFIQSMTDYLQIIFEAYIDKKMKYRTVFEILLKRSDQKTATFITNVIFKKLGLENQESVQLQQIIELCQVDLEFCSAFSKLYRDQDL